MVKMAKNGKNGKNGKNRTRWKKSAGVLDRVYDIILVISICTLGIKRTLNMFKNLLT
jgi:hypothetical protein